MCGRFTLTTTADELHDRFGVRMAQTPAPRWNIAPSQASLIVVQLGLERIARSAEFGLRNDNSSKRLINARAETVIEKPTFKTAFSTTRCLVPASGWYEWAGKGKPFHVQLNNGRMMAFAGLHFESLQPGRPDQFVILTTDADAELAAVHHRCPLVLPSDFWQKWLTCTSVEAQKCLVPPLAHYFNIYPVSPAVGDVRQDNASLVAPLKHEPESASFLPQGDLFG